MFTLFFIMVWNLLSCLMIIFKSPYYSFNIIIMYCLGWFFINLFKHIIKILDTFIFINLFQSLSIFMIIFCFVKINVIQNRLNIKTCSTYYNRRFPFFINFINVFLCKLLEYINIKFIIRLKFIYKIMLYALHFFFFYFGRTYIHIFIYLNGICTYNFAVYGLGKFNWYFCFSNSGRSCYYY